MPSWPSNTRRPVAPVSQNTARAPAQPRQRPTAAPIQRRPTNASNAAPVARPTRPATTPRPPAGPKWDISKFRGYYEDQVNHADELLQIHDTHGAKEILNNTFKRLQQGCRQFDGDPMMRPLYNRIRGWADDVKNRLQIVQAGGDFSPQGSTANLAVAENSNTAAMGEIEALVEATVPEAKANITWDDVIGVEEAVQRIREAVELPHTLPQFFASGVLQPWRGVLLWGPPGTGKTMLAQAAANSVDAKYYCVSAADITSKWMGQGEKFVKALFKSARQQASIIFIDEIDSILTQRSGNEHEAMRRIKTQFLLEMEGFEPTQQVTVIGATNVPWEIDDAALRRLEARVWVPLPGMEARAHMFKHKLVGFPNALTDADFLELARKTNNYSGSDIKVIIKDATLKPVFATWKATHVRLLPSGLYEPCAAGTPGCIPRPSDADLKNLNFVQEVTMKHMLEAIDSHSPSLDSERLVKYDEYRERLQRDKNQD